MLTVHLNRAPFTYWDDATVISYLQRRVIIYSIMYYKMDGSCITDWEYDEICKQLVEFQLFASQEEFQRSQYYYAMYDFDGSTGFDIYGRLNGRDQVYLTDLARRILNMWRVDKHDLQVCAD